MIEPVDKEALVRDGLARIHALAYGLVTEVARRRIEVPALLDALCKIADDAETIMLLQDEQD
jgi:hypothetical protein